MNQTMPEAKAAWQANLGTDMPATRITRADTCIMLKEAHLAGIGNEHVFACKAATLFSWQGLCPDFPQFESLDVWGLAVDHEEFLDDPFSPAISFEFYYRNSVHILMSPC
jgi:hypothetical protein